MCDVEQARTTALRRRPNQGTGKARSTSGLQCHLDQGALLLTFKVLK